MGKRTNRYPFGNVIRILLAMVMVIAYLPQARTQPTPQPLGESPTESGIDIEILAESESDSAAEIPEEAFLEEDTAIEVSENAENAAEEAVSGEASAEAVSISEGDETVTHCGPDDECRGFDDCREFSTADFTSECVDCRCTRTGCPPPLPECNLREVFDQKTCQCVCKDASLQECPEGLVFNPDTCACQCEGDRELCEMRPGYWLWDDENCCYCDELARYSCFEMGLLWDPENCDCIGIPPPPLICDHDHTWEYQYTADDLILPLLPPLPPLPGPDAASLCGNMVAEPGEACDANYDELGVKIAGDDEGCYGGPCKINCECAVCEVPGLCPELQQGDPVPKPPARLEGILSTSQRNRQTVVNKLLQPQLRSAEEQQVTVLNKLLQPHFGIRQAHVPVPDHLREPQYSVGFLEPDRDDAAQKVVRLANGAYAIYHGQPAATTNPENLICQDPSLNDLDHLPDDIAWQDILAIPDLRHVPLPTPRTFDLIDKNGNQIGGCDANGRVFSRSKSLDGTVTLDYGTAGKTVIPPHEAGRTLDFCKSAAGTDCIRSTVTPAAACAVWEDRRDTKKPGSSGPSGAPPPIPPPGVLPLSQYPDEIEAFLQELGKEINRKALKWNLVIGPPGQGSPSIASVSVGDNPKIETAQDEFMPTVMARFDAHTQSDIALCRLAAGGGTGCSAPVAGRRETIEEINRMRAEAGAVRLPMIDPILQEGYQEIVTGLLITEVQGAIMQAIDDPLAGPPSPATGFDQNGAPLNVAPTTIGEILAAVSQLQGTNKAINDSDNPISKHNQELIEQLNDAYEDAAQDALEDFNNDPQRQERMQSGVAGRLAAVVAKFEKFRDEPLKDEIDFAVDNDMGSKNRAQLAGQKVLAYLRNEETQEFADYVQERVNIVNDLAVQIKDEQAKINAALIGFKNDVAYFNTIPVTKQPHRTIWRMALAMQATEILAQMERTLLKIQNSYLEGANAWYGVNKAIAAYATARVRETNPGLLCQEMPGPQPNIAPGADADDDAAGDLGDGESEPPPPPPSGTGTGSTAASPTEEAPKPPVPGDAPLVAGVNDSPNEPDAGRVADDKQEEQRRENRRAQREAALKTLQEIRAEIALQNARLGVTTDADGITLFNGAEVYILPNSIRDEAGTVIIPAGTILPLDQSPPCRDVIARYRAALKNGGRPDDNLVSEYQGCINMGATGIGESSLGMLTGPDGEDYEGFINRQIQRSDDAVDDYNEALKAEMTAAEFTPLTNVQQVGLNLWNALEAAGYIQNQQPENVYVNAQGEIFTPHVADDGTISLLNWKMQDGKLAHRVAAVVDGEFIDPWQADLAELSDLILQHNFGRFGGEIEAILLGRVVVNELGAPSKLSLAERGKDLDQKITQFREYVFGARIAQDGRAESIFSRTLAEMLRLRGVMAKAKKVGDYVNALNTRDQERIEQAIKDLGGFEISALIAQLNQAQREQFAKDGQLPAVVVESLLWANAGNMGEAFSINTNDAGAVQNRVGLLLNILQRYGPRDFLKEYEQTASILFFRDNQTLQNAIDAARQRWEANEALSDFELILANQAALVLAGRQALKPEDIELLNRANRAHRQAHNSAFQNLLEAARAAFEAAKINLKKRENARQASITLQGIIASIMGDDLTRRRNLERRHAALWKQLQIILVRQQACEEDSAACNKSEEQRLALTARLIGLQQQIAALARQIDPDTVKRIREQLAREQATGRLPPETYQIAIDQLRYYENLLRALPQLSEKPVVFAGEFSFNAAHLAQYHEQLAWAGNHLFSNPGAFFTERKLGREHVGTAQIILELEGLHIMRESLQNRSADTGSIDGLIADYEDDLRQRRTNLQATMADLNALLGQTTDPKERANITQKIKAHAIALIRLSQALSKTRSILELQQARYERFTRGHLPDDVVVKGPSNSLVSQFNARQDYNLPRGNIEKSFANLRRLGTTQSGDRVYLVGPPGGTAGGFEGRIITVKKDGRILLSHRTYNLSGNDGLGDVIDRLNGDGSGQIRVEGTAFSVGGVSRELPAGGLIISPLGAVLAKTGALDYIETDNDRLTLDDAASSVHNSFPWFANSLQEADKRYAAVGGDLNALRESDQATAQALFDEHRQLRISLYGLESLGPDILNSLTSDMKRAEGSAEAMLAAQRAGIIQAAALHGRRLMAAAQNALQAGNPAQHFELLRSVEAFNGQVAGELRREIDRLEANLHYQKAQALREHREKFIKATLDFIQFRREHTAGLANKSYNIYRDAEGDILVAPVIKDVFDANGRSLFGDIQQRLTALQNERDEDVVIETRAQLLTRLRQILRTTRDIALTRQIARFLADQGLAADAKGMLLADLEAAIAKFAGGMALIDEQIRRLETQLAAATDAAQRQAIEQALTALRTAKGELAGVQQTFNGLSQPHLAQGLSEQASFLAQHGKPFMQLLEGITDPAVKAAVFDAARQVQREAARNDLALAHAAEIEAHRRNGKYNMQTRFDSTTRDLEPSSPLYMVGISNFLIGEGAHNIKDTWFWMTGGATSEQEFYNKLGVMYSNQGGEIASQDKLLHLSLEDQIKVVKAILQGEGNLAQIQQGFAPQNRLTEQDVRNIRNIQKKTLGQLGHRYGVLSARNELDIKASQTQNLIPNQLDYQARYLNAAVTAESRESQFQAPKATRFESVNFMIHMFQAAFSAFTKMRASYKVLTEDLGGQIRAHIRFNIGTQRLGSAVLGQILKSLAERVAALDSQIKAVKAQLKNTSLTQGQREQLNTQLDQLRNRRGHVNLNLVDLAALSRPELETLYGQPLGVRQYQALQFALQNNVALLSTQANEQFGQANEAEGRQLAANALLQQYNAASLAQDFAGAIELGQQISEFDPTRSDLERIARQNRDNQIFSRRLDAGFQVGDMVAGQVAFGRFMGFLGKGLSAVGERLISPFMSGTGRLAAFLTRLQMGTARLFGLRIRQGLIGAADDMVNEARWLGASPRILGQMRAQRLALRRAINAGEEAVREGNSAAANQAVLAVGQAFEKLEQIALAFRSSLVTGPTAGMFGFARQFFGESVRREIMHALSFYVNPKELLDEALDEAGGDLFEFLKATGGGVHVRVQGSITAYVRLTDGYRQQSQTRFQDLLAALQSSPIDISTALGPDGKVVQVQVNAANHAIDIVDEQGNVLKTIANLDSAAQYDFQGVDELSHPFNQAVRQALLQVETDGLVGYFQDLRNSPQADPAAQARIDLTIQQIRQVQAAKAAQLQLTFLTTQNAQRVRNGLTNFAVGNRYLLPLANRQAYLQAQVTGRTPGGLPQLSYQIYNNRGQVIRSSNHAPVSDRISNEDVLGLIMNGLDNGLRQRDEVVDDEGNLRTDAPRDGVVVISATDDIAALMNNAAQALNQLQLAGQALNNILNDAQVDPAIALAFIDLHTAQREISRLEAMPQFFVDANTRRAMQIALIKKQFEYERLLQQQIQQTQTMDPVTFFGKAFNVGQSVRHQGQYAMITALVEGVGVVITTTQGQADTLLVTETDLNALEVVDFSAMTGMTAADQQALKAASAATGISVEVLHQSDQQIEQHNRQVLEDLLAQAAQVDTDAVMRRFDPCASPCGMFGREFQQRFSALVSELRESGVDLPLQLDIAEMTRLFAAGDWLAYQQLFHRDNAYPELAAAATTVLNDMVQAYILRHGDINSEADIALKFPRTGMTLAFLRSQIALTRGEADARIYALQQALTLAENGAGNQADIDRLRTQLLYAHARQNGVSLHGDARQRMRAIVLNHPQLSRGLVRIFQYFTNQGQTAEAVIFLAKINQLLDQVGLDNGTAAPAATRAMNQLLEVMANSNNPEALMNELLNLDPALLNTVSPAFANPGFLQAALQPGNAILAVFLSELQAQGMAAARVVLNATTNEPRSFANLAAALSSPANVVGVLDNIMNNYPARFAQMGGAPLMANAVEALANLADAGFYQAVESTLEVMQGYTQVPQDQLGDATWGQIFGAYNGLGARGFAIYIDAVAQLLWRPDPAHPNDSTRVLLRHGLISQVGPNSIANLRVVATSANAFNEAFEVVATQWMIETGARIQVQRGDSTVGPFANNELPSIATNEVDSFGMREQRIPFDPNHPQTSRATIEADTLLDLIQSLGIEVMIDWKRYLSDNRNLDDQVITKMVESLNNPSEPFENIIIVAPGPWNADTLERIRIAIETELNQPVGLIVGYVAPSGDLQTFLDLSRQREN